MFLSLLLHSIPILFYLIIIYKLINKSIILFVLIFRIDYLIYISNLLYIVSLYRIIIYSIVDFMEIIEI